MSSEFIQLSALTISDIIRYMDQHHHTSPGEFFLSLLDPNIFDKSNHSVPQFLVDILDSLVALEPTAASISAWAINHTIQILHLEVGRLTHASSGFQLDAKNAKRQDLEQLNIQTFSSQMQELGPNLWRVLAALLDSNDPDLSAHRDAQQRYKKRKKSKKDQEKVNRKEIEDGLDTRDIFNPRMEDWVVFDELTREKDRKAERRALMEIKQVVCISIIIQNANVKCNALQALIGLFLHTCSVSESTIEVVAHIGVSVSQTTIHNMVSNLSETHAEDLISLGRRLLVAFGFDNVDFFLEHTSPIVGDPTSSLLHLTSGTLFPLQHGITLGDLSCARELAVQSQQKASQFFSDFEIGCALRKEFPDPLLDSTGMNRRQRWYQWKFLHDLITLDSSFEKFSRDLQDPEDVLRIPLTRFEQLHAPLMDTPCSKPSECDEVLETLLRRCAHIGDPSDRTEESPGSIVDVDNMVFLIFGDLGVGEQIRSLIESRSIEGTPWRRREFVVYVLGLFHVKMACADAIWRIYLKSSDGVEDPMTLENLVRQIRPEETGKIKSNPGFRRMHEVIQHVGAVERLDCWRVLVKKHTKYNTLAEFAASDPSFEDLHNLAAILAKDYVCKIGDKPKNQRPSGCEDLPRDLTFENMLQRQQLFLLYEETTWAMNEGDIGRLEECLIPWMLVASSELSNLANTLPQAIFGGQFSNHKKEYIIKESALIGVYKNAKQQVEEMFRITHGTSRHSMRNLSGTFKKLQRYFEDKEAHEFIDGREAGFQTEDVINKGAGMEVATGQGATAEEDDPIVLEVDDFQILPAQALYEGCDVVSVERTGGGKTLSFWIPLCMSLEDGSNKMLTLVTPLTLLGKQMEVNLKEAGIPCVAVDSFNNTSKTYKDIASGKYSVIVISPELATHGSYPALLKDEKFNKRLLAIIFDEAHTISTWGKTFRDSYRTVGDLRYYIPDHVPFFAASATVTLAILEDIRGILHLRTSRTKYYIRSNDRPTISLGAFPLKHPIDSFRDLAFLIPDNYQIGHAPIPSFLVFFDNTKTTEDATRYLQSRLPTKMRERVKWFHATMTKAFREDTYNEFRREELIGLCVTDAFGMGLDLPNVEVVVQYRIPTASQSGSICAAAQRFGRAARGPNTRGMAILLYESAFSDFERVEAEKRADKKALASAVAAKRKADGDLPQSPRKRAACASLNNIPQTPVTPTTPGTPQSLTTPTHRSPATSPSPQRQQKTSPSVPARHFAIAKGIYNRSEAQRLAAYRATEKQKQNSPSRRKQAKSRTIDLGSAMDDFVNARTRGYCRRNILNTAFNTGRQESAFRHVNDATVSAPPRAPRKSSAKPHVASHQQECFRKELREWVCKTAEAAAGKEVISEFGVCIFMADVIFERIIDIFHLGKLTSSDSFDREVQWRADFKARYGANIVGIASKYAASFPTPTLPSLPSSTNSTASHASKEPVTAPGASSSRTPRQERCSACQGLGHRKNNKLKCPRHPENPANVLSAMTPRTPNPSTSTPIAIPRAAASPTPPPHSVNHRFIPYTAPAQYRSSPLATPRSSNNQNIPPANPIPHSNSHNT
ncbi:hypothetical protein VNI00_006740 [Paramarasmius palmivorus]|uniref:DNA 3'-5' helicase n=1 Tax=Paramarasmius palmivorus TaxID=297713 RepID=A0AAW0D6M5_9AGAR